MVNCSRGAWGRPQSKGWQRAGTSSELICTHTREGDEFVSENSSEGSKNNGQGGGGDSSNDCRP